MITPGTYKATLVKHEIRETKDGLPQVAITFSFEADGKSNTMTWFGSFKEKAQPITIKTLLTCGLKGNNPAGPLDIGREVELVIDDEKGQDGKTRTKIRWVNSLGGVKSAIPQDMAHAKLADLEGAIMAARANLGNVDPDDVIPF